MSKHSENTPIVSEGGNPIRSAGKEAPLCPECGTPPGGEASPRRWAWWRRASVLLTLMAWVGFVSSAGLRAHTTSMTASNWGAHQYPCNAVDSWLDQAQQSEGSWWVREVFMGSWPAGVAIPADEPLEIAVVGTSVSGNVTAWASSSMTVGRMLSPDMTDAEFVRIAREDLERAFGVDWDTPGQTNIAWRAPMSSRYTALHTRVPAWFGRSALARVQRIEIQDYRGRAVVWGRPRWQWRDGWLTLRSGDMSVTGRTRVVEINITQAQRMLGVLGVALVAAWALTPPIWWRIARRRRAKTGRCLRCGYPLLEPVS